MKKIFLDSDVILDLLLEREPYHHSITLLLEKVKSGDIVLHTSSICILNINYILRKSYSHDYVKEVLNKLLHFVNILSVDSGIIHLSLNSDFIDFEDGVQYYCSLNNDISEIITRNIKDYKPSKIPVLTPEEFLETRKNNGYT
ncbi:MAG: PIN domain-containing protein [Ignavibacteria bacterium]|nr:PIN domain-containing protein [Ignavibacteria bacterium]